MNLEFRAKLRMWFLALMPLMLWLFVIYVANNDRARPTGVLLPGVIGASFQTLFIGIFFIRERKGHK